jgi:hypothetical protein
MEILDRGLRASRRQRKVGENKAITLKVPSQQDAETQLSVLIWAGRSFFPFFPSLICL